VSDLAPQHTPAYSAAVLQWYLDNGVDEVLADAPVNRFVKPVPAGVEDKPAPKSAPMVGGSIGGGDVVVAARTAAAAASTLEELQAAIKNFDGIAIRKTAMNLVFADGNTASRVMVIGDVPESDEDRAGKPFMGTAGKLLDKMFAAIGLTRAAEKPEGGIYLTQLLNWRPPGNRSPSPAELDASLPFLQRHIELVKPKHLVIVGVLAAKALLNTDQTVAKLRGKVHIYKSGDTDIPCRVIYAPSTLLKTPLKKREAWDDLCALRDSIGQ
jgi:uracil-DNA glycosylase family 4